MIYQRIRYFLKAAETESFSKAAVQMFVSAQALTKQISLLEEELGDKLFERSPQGVKLTQYGAYVRDKFARVDREFEEAMRDARSRAGHYKCCLNIGIFSAMPQDILVTPMISYLMATYPEYQINLKLMDLFAGKQHLMDGKIDILLSNIHEQDDLAGYRVLSYKKFEANVVVSLRHPWAMKDTITVSDMQKEVFLKMDEGESAYNVPEKQIFYNHIPCREVVRVANFDTMCALLQQGEAFAIFPMFFSNMDQAKFKGFAYPGQPFYFHAAMVYNPNNPLEGLGKIMEDLQEEFELKELELLLYTYNHKL